MNNSYILSSNSVFVYSTPKFTNVNIIQNGLDLKFINRASKVTSFNLVSKDLQNLRYKKEIQYLFNKNLFPEFNLNSTIDLVDKDKLNILINELRLSNNFNFLHNYNLKGFGPGEITLYFLINTSYLGGGSSAGIDMFVEDKKYEIKAVSITKDGFAYNFKLGGNVPLSSTILSLINLTNYFKLEGNKTEIKSSVLSKLKELDSSSFKKIEEEYAEIAYENYFKNHEIIFINNAVSSRLGLIESIKYVKKDDIFIERVTSGTVKPRIKLCS